jgi:hypothetical protein
MKPNKIYLSPPDVGSAEIEYVLEAFQSNWVAPAGPNLDAFEQDFAQIVGSKHAVAVSSGTAALHLALRLAGVGPGDEVLCSSLTFVASASPITYLGAKPVFIDSEERSWNMDPALACAAIEQKAKAGKPPKALILVHLYGQAADITPIKACCDKYGVKLIEDAAEALGATYGDASPGSFGLFGIHSFNGNKVASEIIIEHVPDMGGDLLYICIPIISSTNTSDATLILSDIIQTVSTNAPNEGETCNLNISNLNLNNIVPKQPFFAYTGTSGLKGQIIVYGINYAIPLNESTLSILQKIIQIYPLALTGGQLFFNKVGPNNIQLNDGIYISCQPTGSSEEETQVSYNNSSKINNDFAPIFNKTMKIIIICILCVIIFTLLSFGYNYFTK